MTRASILSILLVLPLVAVICITAIWTPTMHYDMRSGSPSPEAASLMKLAGRLLPVGKSVPHQGAQLAQSGNRLEWDMTTPSGQRIARVEFSCIRISATRPLLFHLLDDDPHALAEIDATLTTDRGVTQTVRIQLWDYARVTPWSLQRLGDGWKPASVAW